MASDPKPLKKELESTYIVQDRQSEQELARLTIQDKMLTASMGGVLSEQDDPTRFHSVLDIACGTGGWLINVAQLYSTISRLEGIDISRRMIEYAQAKAQTQGVDGRIEFHVMDALRLLEYPDDTFDLVNLRLGSSFLRTMEWPKLLTEMIRVARSGGVVRVTDGEIGNKSSSAASRRFFDMLLCAMDRSGHLFTPTPAGVNDHLTTLLTKWGCEQVQSKEYTVEYRAGTEAGEASYEDTQYLFKTARPFLAKWGCASKDYEEICRKALEELRLPDAYSIGNFRTAWGIKPLR